MNMSDFHHAFMHYLHWSHGFELGWIGISLPCYNTECIQQPSLQPMNSKDASFYNCFSLIEYMHWWSIFIVIDTDLWGHAVFVLLTLCFFTVFSILRNFRHFKKLCFPWNSVNYDFVPNSMDFFLFSVSQKTGESRISVKLLCPVTELWRDNEMPAKRHLTSGFVFVP